MSELKATIGNEKNTIKLSTIRRAFMECFKDDKNSTVLGLMEEEAFCDIGSMSTILSKLDAFRNSPFGDRTYLHIKELISKLREKARIYGGEELVITFQNEILKATIKDMDENKTERYIIQGGYVSISDGIYDAWDNHLNPIESRKKVRTAVCEYLSKYPETKDTVERLKFFIGDSDRMFYDIIENMQKKTNKSYIKLSPLVNHNLEDNFVQNVYLFDDESIEILPEGFCVNKPNGTNKVIATVVA